MQTKKQIIKSQKKFRHFKDQSPIYLFETFEHREKTHYILSTNSILYIGYMEKTTFNQIINYEIESYASSFCLFQDTLYFGLKNGRIIFTSLEAAYNQIPFKKVQSINGNMILGICATSQESQKKKVYTISQDNFLGIYRQDCQSFIFQKNILIDSKIQKVVSKSLSQNKSLPCFMVYLQDYKGYPILLTIQDIDKLLEKKLQFCDLVKSRDKNAFRDEKCKFLYKKVFERLTSMDFDNKKMIVSLGYNDGSVEVHKIEKTTDGDTFYFTTPQLRVLLKQNIGCVSIISECQLPYVAYVSESNFSGIDYETISAPFVKVRVEKQKDISVVRWMKNKFFLAAAVSTEEKRRMPKVYCIEQDVADA